MGIPHIYKRSLYWNGLLGLGLLRTFLIIIHYHLRFSNLTSAWPAVQLSSYQATCQKIPLFVRQVLWMARDRWPSQQSWRLEWPGCSFNERTHHWLQCVVHRHSNHIVCMNQHLIRIFLGSSGFATLAYRLKTSAIYRIFGWKCFKDSLILLFEKCFHVHQGRLKLSKQCEHILS